MEKKEISVRNTVEVAGEYDLVIVGGGIAGIGAALAARRSGCKTLIVEKSVMMGGLATLGMIAWYLPLCDGRGRKIIGGIAEELLHLSIKYGYNSLPKEWTMGAVSADTKERYQTRFSPAEFVIAMDELLQNEKIDFVFDTLFSEPVMEGNKCTGIIVDEKGGRKAYFGKMFIDASGDSDLMKRAGMPCIDQYNWMVYWALISNFDLMQKAIDNQDIYRSLNLKWYGHIPEREDFDKTPKYYARNAKEITSFILKGRQRVLKDLKEWDPKKNVVEAIPGMPQVRTTCRLDGEYLLVEEDIFKHFDDSIGAVCDFRHRGPIYEIPYRTLRSKSVSNILAAGRNISSDGDAWEVTRVIPPACLTGQAAGTAAALALEYGTDVHGVDIKRLQSKLSETGVMIHY